MIVDGSNEHPRILWVPDIVRELRSRGRYTELDYFGQTEWLIWNKVPGSAIVATLSVDVLRKYATEHPSVDRVLCFTGIQASKTWFQYHAKIQAVIGKVGFSAGHAIGLAMALWGLPRAHLVSMASKIAHVWRFRDIKDQQKHEEYCKGVHASYEEFFCRGRTLTARRCLEAEDDNDLDKDDEGDDDNEDDNLDEGHNLDVDSGQDRREEENGETEVEAKSIEVNDSELDEISSEPNQPSNNFIQDVFAARRSEINSVLGILEHENETTSTP